MTPSDARSADEVDGAAADTPSRRGGRAAVVVVLAVVLLVLAAGGGWVVGQRPSNGPVPLADVVTCSVWTRPNDQTQPRSAGELRIDWRTAATGEGTSSEQTASGDGLTLSARYSYPFPPTGHVLSILVSDSQGRRVQSVLYQIYEGPTDQFVSHGFTGLHYVNDTATGAEMQYTCTAV